MAKRREVDWAEEIVEGMKKPLPRSAGDWNAVKITCVDEKIVLGMLRSFFPEGPRAAMSAHAENKTWVLEGQEKAERRVSVAWHACQTGEAPSEGLRRWDELRENFEKSSAFGLLSRWRSPRGATP
jgi:hypothetical protein